MRVARLFLLALTALHASVVVGADTKCQGFTSGTRALDNKVKNKNDYLKEFGEAQRISDKAGTFNSVRLFTMLKETENSGEVDQKVELNPAIEAAIETNTTMLLGIWCSHVENINKEIEALKMAVEKHESNFTDLVVGISVGSDDIYRSANKQNGKSAKEITKYIEDVKRTVNGTALNDTPIGHSEPWYHWVNNTDVMKNIGFVGVHIYPFDFSQKGVDEMDVTGKFEAAFQAVKEAAGRVVPVWIVGTGWPRVGEPINDTMLNSGGPLASILNAEWYWNKIGCEKLFNDKENVWWNGLVDSYSDLSDHQYALNPGLNDKPYFPLTCGDAKDLGDEMLDMRPSRQRSSTDSSSAQTQSSTASAAASSAGSEPTTTEEKESATPSASNSNTSNTSSAESSVPTTTAKAATTSSASTDA